MYSSLLKYLEKVLTFEVKKIWYDKTTRQADYLLQYGMIKNSGYSKERQPNQYCGTTDSY